MTDDEKNILCKGFNFKLAWIDLSTQNFYYILSYHFVTYNMKIKARLLDIALTSYQNLSSDQDPPENLIPSEP